jgi:murein DD-endopeptidase MepM/ murein hydrolase activator NlpD
VNLGRQLLSLLALAAACAGPTDSRDRLASELRDRVGDAADPHVSFLRDSTHLQVELATVAFRTMPESVLTDQARNIGVFALRHYERANEVDSVTVLYREAVSPGFWYIRHTRTFPVGELRNVGTGAKAYTALDDSSVTKQHPRDSTVGSVVIYPFTHQHFVCLEHPLGQLRSLGDALGSDCVIVRLGSGAQEKFPSFYRTNGAQNSDWIGWNASVLAPFSGVVDSVYLNAVANTPGVLGKARASVIIFRRGDGLRVLVAHVQDIRVNVGDSVSAGERVASVGNNGAAYFPHTHIGAYKDGAPLQIRFDLAAMGRMTRADIK